MASSYITFHSGYNQVVSGLCLNREGITIPFGFGTDWTKIGIGITAANNGDASQPQVQACGFQPDRRYWFGVKTNNGGFPNCPYYGDGDFIGFSSSSFSGGASTSMASGKVYSTTNFNIVGSSLSLLSNFYLNPSSFASISVQTGIYVPLLPFNSDTGDYTNFVLMLTKSYGANGGFTGEFLYDTRPVSATGQIPAMVTKYPDLWGLNSTMDNFYNLDHSGYSSSIPTSSPSFTQDSAFIYTPYTGWQIASILIKRYA